MSRTIRAVRGAITVAADDPFEIRDATQEILDEVLHLNELERDDIISAIFTVTPDLTSEFPAYGARLGGWTDIPMICAQEAPVAGALPLCIRVLLHVYTWRPRSDIRHAYLRDAVMLRPDLKSD